MVSSAHPASPVRHMAELAPRAQFRMCFVRVKGTQLYVGDKECLTTRDKARQFTFPEAETKFPNGKYRGIDIQFETCRVITRDSDW